MNRLIVVFLLFLASCARVPAPLEPQINCVVQDRYLKALPAPFPDLTTSEKQQDWGKEYLIGLTFARELDLYRAITAFRRAKILAPESLKERQLELDYEILLAYYLGRRFEEVDATFTQSPLAKADTSFPAFHDLLVILYDTYNSLGNSERATQILALIQTHYPQTYDGLSLSTALREADFPVLSCSSQPAIQEFLNTYESQKKSVGTAKLLNALIPGAGYLYIGQRQTALTAFLVNGLFIAASVQFFRKGYIAAGVITTSFEAGWYFGGISGAAQETKLYNERLYECCASPMMNRAGLFPVFMLKFAF